MAGLYVPEQEAIEPTGVGHNCSHVFGIQFPVVPPLSGVAVPPTHELEPPKTTLTPPVAEAPPPPVAGAPPAPLVPPVPVTQMQPPASTCPVWQSPSTWTGGPPCKS